MIDECWPDEKIPNSVACVGPQAVLGKYLVFVWRTLIICADVCGQPLYGQSVCELSLVLVCWIAGRTVRGITFLSVIGRPQKLAGPTVRAVCCHRVFHYRVRISFLTALWTTALFRK